MLILSRKAGQSFYVGDDVEIIVLECQGDKVKIGIKAPDNVNLVRSELRETEKANLAASQVTPQMVLEVLKNGYLKQK